MDGVTQVPVPTNEPVLDYEPGSPAREALVRRMDELWGECPDLPCVIAEREQPGTGGRIDVVAPFEHAHRLAGIDSATVTEAQQAVNAAAAAAPSWRAMSFDERAAIFLRAAELAAGPWRSTLNAATMLGQAKTVIQAEIDSACELIDFWRFNVHFARQIMAEQPPINPKGVWNRTDHRPLEGFVYAITPFNFTAIAGNLPTAPALMGNTVIWKPSTTQALAAHYTMRLLVEAGLPPGVINLMQGHGAPISEVLLTHPDLAGIHFTGSTRTFHHLWRTVGENISGYRGYPRLVGETGGKDFVLAHPSADVDVLRTALVRGAFEYSGQKCSAASRAFVPQSIWNRMKDELVDLTNSLQVGSVRDLTNFTSAVIDARAYEKLSTAVRRAQETDGVQVIAGGECDDSTGYFVRPTIAVCDDPRDEAMTVEYFGPLLAVHVYDDAAFEDVMNDLDDASPYALTGSIIAGDRAAVARAGERLRFAAGNFYVNDKPTGAVVGQQPFGGARASGTNDKAGSKLNLLRWTSPRSIKETLAPPTSHRYPHMGDPK